MYDMYLDRMLSLCMYVCYVCYVLIVNGSLLRSLDCM
jgi:hypothetical protein